MASGAQKPTAPLGSFRGGRHELDEIRLHNGQIMVSNLDHDAETVLDHFGRVKHCYVAVPVHARSVASIFGVEAHLLAASDCQILGICSAKLVVSSLCRFVSPHVPITSVGVLVCRVQYMFQLQKATS